MAIQRLGFVLEFDFFHGNHSNYQTIALNSWIVKFNGSSLLRTLLHSKNAFLISCGYLGVPLIPWKILGQSKINSLTSI